MFRRFLWTLKGPDWFDLFASDLFQKLLKEPTYETLKIDFISKLREWMNIRPKEVISFWVTALKDDDRLADEIIFALDKFECWETEGIRELLDLLMTKSKGGIRRFIGKAISRYVERTDKGDDLLWNFIIANVSMDKLDWSFFNDYEGLQCSEHDFHTNTFLKDRICKSDQLLNLCLAAVEDWSSHYSSYYAEKLFRDSFLNFTSWVMKHERGDATIHAPLLELLSGIEYALITLSKSYDNWWQLSEPLLRKTLEAAIAYLMIRAYRANIENNGPRIMEFLERSDIFQNGHLDYELGELIQDAFPYMDNDFQERLQRKILGFSSKKEGVAEEQEWVVRKIYEYVCWIPALFRFPEVQSFVEKWTHKFGLWPLPPRAYSRGGWVRSPISAEQMLVLSDKTIVKLLMFYGKDMKHFYEEDRLIGGTDNVISTFRDCCAIDPVRFSPFIERIYQEKIYNEYAIAVMEGVASHLSYRFGNVRPAKEWKPAEPLLDGPSLGVSILKWLNIYPDLWNNGYAVAWALRSCCYVLEEPEDVEWLILFLARLANHRDPDEVKQTVFSKDKTTITEDDLGHIALNSVRGIVAEAAIDLATNLLKKGKELPELLSILLIRFAKDRNAGVRAASLTNLPLLTHYDFELGWDIFSKAFKDPHGHLWSFGERFLYYQYHGHFETVKPYLDRMKVEAIESAGETWGRISTLCYLSGHLTEGQLFHDLVGLNGKGSWLGATEVFAANIGDSKTRGVCEEGILRILKNRPMLSEVLQRIDAMFDHLPVDGKEAEIRIAESFVTAFESGQAFCERHWFFDWVAKLSNNSPRSALEICDKILKKIAEAEPPRHLWHAEGIVSASLRILREADELDDQEFIRRAIHFQDQLLQLGFPEIQEAMDKAGRD